MLRIVLCCDNQVEAEFIKEQAEALLSSQDRLDFHVFTSLTDFLSYIRMNPYLIMIVTREGSSGFDAVRKARLENPDARLIWFSQKEYALLSYQLNVSYFSLLPVEAGHLAAAMRACSILKGPS